MATLSIILAWRIAWAEVPGGLQSIGSQLDMTEQLKHTVSGDSFPICALMLVSIRIALRTPRHIIIKFEGEKLF